MQIPKITLADLKEHLGALRVLVIDVREECEYQEMHIEGTVHIPLKALPLHLKEFENYDTIITLCAHGVRSKRGCEYLANLPCNVTYVDGDIEKWESANLPIIYGPSSL